MFYASNENIMMDIFLIINSIAHVIFCPLDVVVFNIYTTDILDYKL